MATVRTTTRTRRKLRIRKKVSGSASRPRLTVFRSLKHIYAQVVDDETSKVLASASCAGKGNGELYLGMSKVDRAKKVGAVLAETCKAKGIEAVVFDRNGYNYHGRVRALADAARESGLNF